MSKILVVLVAVAFLMVLPVAIPHVAVTVVAENNQDAEIVVLDSAATTTISIEWSRLDSAWAADEEQEEDFWDWLCRLFRWDAGGSHGY